MVLDLTASLLTGITLGYEFDSLAISEVVKLTEVVLPDHKDILVKAENAANLGTVLNVFLSAGWPEATRLISIRNVKSASVPESTGKFSTVANRPSHRFSRNMNPLVRSEWIVGS